MSHTVPLLLLIKYLPVTPSKITIVGGGNGGEITHIISYQRAHQNQVVSLAHTQKLILRWYSTPYNADILLEKSNEKGQIINRSADTDVLVLALYYYQHMYYIKTSQIWIQAEIVTAMQDKWRYIPVHEVLVGYSVIDKKDSHESHHQIPRDMFYWMPLLSKWNPMHWVLLLCCHVHMYNVLTIRKYWRHWRVKMGFKDTLYWGNCAHTLRSFSHLNMFNGKRCPS